MKSTTSSIENRIHFLCKEAKAAAYSLANLSESKKNEALSAIAQSLQEQSNEILTVNKQEIEQASGLNKAFLDRLLLTNERWVNVIDGIKAIIALPDPVGHTIASWSVPTGLKISRTSIPLGVIGVIYESRPNVTADAAALCLKSGNAVILRGGSECELTNRAIVNAIQDGLKAVELPCSIIQYVPDQSRDALNILLEKEQYIDVIIPRGGKGLIHHITHHSQIPVFSHLAGLCHTYIHQDANPEMAVSIISNAKMRRTGICGATETLLIDEAIAKPILPLITDALIKEGCELRGDPQAQNIDGRILSANSEDWHTEYLDAILSIRIVKDMNQAIDHIKEYGSEHTDAIVTENNIAAEEFLQQVNSANVLHNCSTQFADGAEFGLGAEIGIATGKLHARGPVGLEQLTTFKYQVRGNGQIRA